MKKRFFCILLVVLLCAALCACGSDRMYDNNRKDDMDILPDTSPMLSPDPNDGKVTDQDGIIGNGHSGGTGNRTGGVTVSPSPSTDVGMNSPKPSASPSASPKP